MTEQDEREAYNEYHREEADFYAECEPRPCICADPENCTDVPGQFLGESSYVCRRRAASPETGA